VKEAFSPDLTGGELWNIWGLILAAPWDRSAMATSRRRIVCSLSFPNSSVTPSSPPPQPSSSPRH